jgi:hypothetical protein
MVSPALAEDPIPYFRAAHRLVRQPAAALHM